MDILNKTKNLEIENNVPTLEKILELLLHCRNIDISPYGQNEQIYYFNYYGNVYPIKIDNLVNVLSKQKWFIDRILEQEKIFMEEVSKQIEKDRNEYKINIL